MQDAVKIVCPSCEQTNRIPYAKLSAGPKCGVCGDPLVSGKVIEFDQGAHDKATRTDELPLVVDYWAPWCGPCRMMAPEFAKAAQAVSPQVRFAKINTQDFPGVSQKLNIRGIPLLILWHRGREIGRLTGARPASEIEAFVRQSAKV